MMAGPRCPALSSSQGIRARLRWLVFACVVPAAVAAGVALVVAYQGAQAAMAERAQAAARSIAMAVDVEIAHAISGLQVLSTSAALGRGDLAEFHESARRQLPFLSGNNIVLSDADGQQLVNTLVPFGQALPRHGNPAMLSRVLMSGEPVVSDLFIGGVTRRPLAAVEIPVRVGAEGRGGLAMGFFPERFAALIDAMRQDKGWVVSIFDGSGTIVARTHEAERFVGQKGARVLIEALPRTREGVVHTQTLEGVDVVAAFSHLNASDWSVAVGIPEQVLMTRLERWTEWLFAATAALLLFGIGLAHRLARRVAGSIAALVPLADALGRGEPVQAPRLDLAESQAVASAMVRASNLLQARTSERDTATRARDSLQTHTSRLEEEARRDPLTGLSNRVHFVSVLEERLAHARSHGGSLSVFFIDIDDFKPVNDTYGHAVGDDLLRAVATRLRAGVRECDTVARLGGDEYAVLIDGLPAMQARTIARTLVERLSMPYTVREHVVRVSACIGVADYPGAGFNASDLLEAADEAMYQAKETGKGRSVVSGVGAL